MKTHLWLVIALVTLSCVYAATNETPTFWVNETCPIGAGTQCNSTTTTYVSINNLSVSVVSGGKYLWLVSATTTANTTGSAARINLYTDGTLVQNSLKTAAVASTDWFPHSFAYLDTPASTATRNYTVRVSSQATTTKAQFREVRSMLIRLDNLTNSNVTVNNSVAAWGTNVNNVWVDTLGTVNDTINLTITPATAGEYLILGSAEMYSSSASLNIAYRLNIDGVLTPVLGSGDATWGYGLSQADSTSDYNIYSFMHIVNLSAATHTISFQVADTDTTASADWKWPKLVAIRLTDVFNYSYANVTVEQNTTSTTMQTAASTTIPSGISAIVFGGAYRRGVTTGVDYEAQLLTNNGTLNLSKHERRSLDANDYESFFIFGNTTASSSSQNVSLQHKRQDASGTSSVKSGWVFYIVMNATPSVPPSCTDSTTLSACATLNCSTTYTLSANISTTGSCFTLNNNSVILNGAGFTVDGDDGAADVGIAVGGFANNTVKNIIFNDFGTGIQSLTASTNVTVSNASFTSGSGSGIDLYLSSAAIINDVLCVNNSVSCIAGDVATGYHVLTNITVLGTGNGIQGLTNSTITRANMNLTGSSSKGLLLNNGYNNVTLNCAGGTIDGADGGTSYGLSVASMNNTVSNCIVTDFYSGIYLSAANNSVTNCTASSNTNAGFEVSGATNTLTNTSAYENDVYGLLAGAGSIVTRFSANGSSSDYGIRIFGSSVSINGLWLNVSSTNYGVYGNTEAFDFATIDCAGGTILGGGTGTGVYFTATDNNTVRNCTITGLTNGVVIDANSQNHTITNNTITDNAVSGLNVSQSTSTGGTLSLNYICGNPTDATDADLNTWTGNTCDSGASYCLSTCPAADTCTYSGSGAWTIALADNCIITSNYDLGGNRLTVEGTTGVLTVNANITGIGDYLWDFRGRIIRTGRWVLV
jgi:parallel beta-helix repeat protein